ncbi:MAG: hypothetical protein ACR2NU_17335 [Aeoliella sp.]
MNLLPWLEKRFGRFAVPNVTLMIIIGQVAAFLVATTQMQAGGGVPLLENMQLVPSRVLSGEIWRAVTFVIYPPSLNLILALIGWFVFYLMGSMLEATWGMFRYNAFLLIGYLATVAAAFITYLTVGPDFPTTNVFYLSSVFLAFARLFPEYVFRLFFILPIKVKWLALIQWLSYGFLLLQGPMEIKLAILAAVLNYILFFWRDHYRDLKDHQRRTAFQAKVAPKTKSGRMKHTCTTCGLTSEDEPRTSFRYCSQCAGQACYCPDHIRDHEHVADRTARE